MSASTSAGEAPAVGPRPTCDVEERCVRTGPDGSARDSGVSPAVSTDDPPPSVDTSSQFSAGVITHSMGDRGSPLGPDYVHTAVVWLVARWGLGGVLAELERLGAEHAGLPAEAHAARLVLAVLVAAYAPAGSTTAALANRAEPCPLCASEAAFLRRLSGVARG